MKTSLLLVIAAISAMGQDIKFTVSVVHRRKRIPWRARPMWHCQTKSSLAFRTGLRTTSLATICLRRRLR